MRRLSASLPLVPEDGEVAIAALVDLASSGEHAALRVDRSLRRAAVFVGRSRQRVMIANSEGNFAEDVRDRLRCRVQATAEDRAGTRVGVGTRAAGVCGPPLELDPVDVGRRAGRQALLQLQAGPSPFGPMPVVLASGAAATLLHETFGHALMLASSGGRSVLSGRLDERIGSPALRIVDDGRISGGWGSGRHDDEGHPTGVTALLEEGRLRSFLYDRQSGSELGAAGSTGNARRTSFKSLPRPRTTNMYVSPGTATRQDVIEATPSGLYVEALAGGRADPVTGDFCFSVREACLIRDGHLCHPVRGASLGGNLIQLLEAVDLVGDDLELAAGNCPLYNEPLCMGIGQPTLRIARLMVGGQLQGKNVNEDIAAAAGLA
jgi:TldD protein